MRVIDDNYLRENTLFILDEIERGEKYIVESEGKEAVILSKAEFTALLETLYVLSDPDVADEMNDSDNSSGEDMTA